MWKLIINTDDHIEWISDFLSAYQALAVSLQDAGEQPLFQEALNEAPLWKNTQVQGLFAEHHQAQAVIQALQTALQKVLTYQIDSVPDQDWVQVTQNQFPPRCFANRLWVLPAWQEDFNNYPGIILRIEPGLGFGTGAHPTTGLCLNWLAQQNLQNKTVIDYGCGSGILSLAAMALGARSVWAVDHDPQALIATTDNAKLNHFSPFPLSTASMASCLYPAFGGADARNEGGALRAAPPYDPPWRKESSLQRELLGIYPVLPEQLPEIKADIILANILANPLCELAPKLMQHLNSGAFLVLSGFLSSELDRVAAAYQPPLQQFCLDMQEDWVFIVLKRV